LSSKGSVVSKQSLPRKVFGSTTTIQRRNKYTWFSTLALQTRTAKLKVESYGAVKKATITIQRRNKYTWFSTLALQTRTAKLKVESYGAVKKATIL
jgi:hypothetical protein